MRCLQCQAENPPEARFCNACGVRLVFTCPGCAHSNPPGSRFCNQCGQTLDAVARTATGRTGSPGSYTPAHLAEKILTSRASLEGERKHVTVLFADLRGSLELLAERDPEEARSILDPILELMMEAVHRYEGTVNQVMGDGIMALFGAPIAHEDHAVRACYAALAMQANVNRYGDEAQRSQGAPLQIRVGLNSGEVVVRSIGSDLHMDYTAVGQTTHLAARMEQLAKAGSILITADTLRWAEGYVQVKPLGLVSVKGLSLPVEAYELTGASAVRTRLQAAAARGLTRFVGRSAELEELRRALEKAERGHGQVVAVVGEPGVGKSRLCYEFVHSPQAQGWLTLETRPVSYGKATAYLPVADVLRAYFQVRDRDEARSIREKIGGKLVTLDPTLLPTLPIFHNLLDVAAEDPHLQALDLPTRRQRTLEALKRLLLLESQVQPLLLVFEDLHWIDSETQAVLDSLVDSLPTSRLLVLVTYRPEYQHSWANKTCYSQLRVDPLPAESAETLLDALLGEDGGLAPLKRLLIQRTEGNPFFLEESVWGLVETKALVGERGAYRVARPVGSIQVAPTVQAVLAARIDRLAPADKALLQTAAVIGKDASFALLQVVAELPEEELRRGLAHLQAAEFLYEASLFPELEYTFRHSLTHEVAYGALLQGRRRALHARIVDAFETLYPGRAGEKVAWLAHHAFRGEVWSKALAYLHQTVEEAAPASLDAVLEGPQSAGYAWWSGDHERAIKVGQRELAIAADFANFALRVVTTFRLGQAYHSLGDYPQALTFLRRNVDALEGDLRYERFGMAGLPSVFSRSWLAWCLAARGEFAEGIAHGEEAIRTTEAVDHPYSLIVACCGLGALYLLKGELERAIALLERGLVVEQMANIALLFPFVAAPLGSAYALLGRIGEASRLLEQAAERAASMNLMANHSLRFAWLAEAHLLARGPENAAQLAGQALEVSRRHKERGHEGWALRLLGELASHPDSLEAGKAEAYYRQAMGLADELGVRPLLAHCHLGLGKLFRRAGTPQNSQEHLLTARAMFREMDMRFWLAQAEAEMQGLKT